MNHSEMAAIIKIHGAELSLIEELADSFAENDVLFNRDAFIKAAGGRAWGE